MKRRSVTGNPGRGTTHDVGEFSLGPKYAPIPDFGVVVLESRHAPEWAASGWFDEDFNKFLFLVSGAILLRTHARQYHIGPTSLAHLVARTPHFIEDRPDDPVVLYVIHYRPTVLPESLGNPSHPFHHRQWSRQSQPESYARMVGRLREQIRELLSNYGTVELMRFDCELPGMDWADLQETLMMARRLCCGSGPDREW